MKKLYYNFGAAITVGLLMSQTAQASDFNKIAENIVGGVSNLPSLITALAYLFGTLLAVLGIMKIKDHVENPSQTPLKDGAIRLLAGGALFAVPIVTEAMTDLLNDGSAVGGAATAKLNAVEFNIN